MARLVKSDKSVQNVAMIKNQYSCMHWRASRRLGNYVCVFSEDRDVESLGALRWARAILASQKGRPTVFKRSGRPGVEDLCDEFGTREPWSEDSEAARLLARLGMPEEQVRSIALDWGIAARDSTLLRAEFAELRRIGSNYSLHDSLLLRVERKPNELSLEFGRSFGENIKEEFRRLLFVFKNPRIKAVVGAKLAVMAPVGSWELAAGGGKRPAKEWFLREHAGTGKLAGKGSRELARVMFNELTPVRFDEYALASEAEPELRLCFGGFRDVELAVAGEDVEIVWGASAIEARRQSRLLDASVPGPEISRKGPRI